MNNILRKILKHKETEVDALKQRSDLMEVKKRESNKSFKDSLLQDGLSIIAEIKRKSPSKGELAEITNPIELALDYVQGGANAISVLTDNKYFGGSGKDLTAVVNALKDTPVTVLRKDFIIDPIQIDEAIMLGADAVLLIVAALEDRLQSLLEYAKAKNIDALVEVHNLTELELAVAAGAEIIGVNNRDLTTFQVDIIHSLELISQMPPQIITVSESGVDSATVAQQLYGAGFDAVLVGEALVRSPNPANFIEQMRESNSDMSSLRKRGSSIYNDSLDSRFRKNDNRKQQDNVERRSFNQSILIKICGIKDPNTAVAAAELGADFIGMIFYAKSKRNISVKMAAKICQALKTTNAKPVGVFVDQSAAEIVEICNATGITIVQLHGEHAKNSVHKLPQNIKRIYVIAVDYDGTILDKNDQKNIKYLDKDRDYLLFDGANSGSGKAFPLAEFTNKYNFLFFLSGGLNADNVKTAIKMTHPDGVDVATGVENAAGEKNEDLIQQFISLVKTAEETS